MPKKERTQEFIKALKNELSISGSTIKDPRVERIKEISKEKHLPPSITLNRMSHFSRRSMNGYNQETWSSIAAIVYEMWLAENYPDDA